MNLNYVSRVEVDEKGLTVLIDLGNPESDYAETERIECCAEALSGGQVEVERFAGVAIIRIRPASTG